jgi:hypothetical protein
VRLVKLVDVLELPNEIHNMYSMFSLVQVTDFPHEKINFVNENIGGDDKFSKFTPEAFFTT